MISTVMGNHSPKTPPCAANPPCQLYVLLHDRYAFRMDGAQIRIFEQMYQEGFCCFL